MEGEALKLLAALGDVLIVVLCVGGWIGYKDLRQRVDKNGTALEEHEAACAKNREIDRERESERTARTHERIDGLAEVVHRNEGRQSAGQ